MDFLIVTACLIIDISIKHEGLYFKYYHVN